MKQQSSQSTASPEPNVPRGFQRCQARNRDRSQCRLHAQDPATGLCSRHALIARKTADKLDDSVDLSRDILAVNDGAYESTDHINAILSNVVVLVAEGRISPRRAAVITYALSLMLRSVVVMDRKAANQPTQIIIDVPRPNRDPVEPAAGAHDNADPHTTAKANATPGNTPMDSFDAAERYSRIRT